MDRRRTRVAYRPTPNFVGFALLLGVFWALVLILG